MVGDVHGGGRLLQANRFTISWPMFGECVFAVFSQKCLGNYTDRATWGPLVRRSLGGG